LLSGKSYKSATWFEPAVVFLLAFITRLLYSQPNAHFDEFYHILAAESLVERGSLIIADGDPYTRGWLFTHMVAAAYRLLGQSIWAARFPSVLAGSFLIAAVFWWTRRNVDRISAWAASLLLCFSALAIHHSLMSRFYMVQALCVWIVAMAAYQAFNSEMSRIRLTSLVALGMIAALVACHLQVTSLIPIAAIGVWCAAELCWRIADGDFSSGRGRWTIVLFVLSLIVALGVVYQSSLLSGLLFQYRGTAIWAQSRKDYLLYYHAVFRYWLPTLWILTPMMLVLSLRKRWKPVLYCWAIFTVAFITQSAGGMKAPRYVAYCLPFFFVPWGIAFGSLIPYLSQQVALLMQPVERGVSSRRLISAASWLVAVSMLVFALFFNNDFRQTPRLILGNAASPIVHADWKTAGEVLQPTLDSYDVVLTSASTKALYHLRRFDIAINSSELDSRPEFSIIYQVGRPVISSVDSLRRIVKENKSGLIVIETGHWRDPRFVPVPISEYIESTLRRLESDGDGSVIAYYW
jgi:4-amino-4-deoxy-L-arabinose transferase-like glycosyltransferase